MAEYKYDAWGNHRVYTGTGIDITDNSSYNNSVAKLNPFRYRGYYYDTETGLYYLNSRYYDPSIGRFINADDISYIQPEQINGLNLFAYCGNNPVIGYDPNGNVIWSLLFAAFIGAVASVITSVVVQSATTGSINWGQVGISALFGAVGGLLSFTGIGGVVGQFIIQGTLGVGELYSIAALNDTLDSIGIEEAVATFLFAGGLGAIGAGNAAKEFKCINQIEADFIKYTIRDIKKYAKPVFSTIFARGSKYFRSFVVPTVKASLVSTGINAMVGISTYWIQRLYDSIK